MSRASSMILAACSRALDGMQPTLRHTPPRVGQRSTSTTFLPRSAARKAAVYPPGPAPSTRMSACRSALLVAALAAGAGGALLGDAGVLPRPVEFGGCAAARLSERVTMRLPWLTL